MIRYSVFYPVTEGASFDHDYHRDQHVPLAATTWSPDSAAREDVANYPTIVPIRQLSTIHHL